MPSSVARKSPDALALAKEMKNNQHALERLLTVEQVAEYLNVDKFTVYRLLAQRKLPGFKVGNQWRFKLEIIEAWLMKNAKKPRK